MTELAKTLALAVELNLMPPAIAIGQLDERIVELERLLAKARAGLHEALKARDEDGAELARQLRDVNGRLTDLERDWTGRATDALAAVEHLRDELDELRRQEVAEIAELAETWSARAVEAETFVAVYEAEAEADEARLQAERIAASAAATMGTAEPIDALIARSSVGQGLANIREHGIDAELAELDRELALLPAEFGGPMPAERPSLWPGVLNPLCARLACTCDRDALNAVLAAMRRFDEASDSGAGEAAGLGLSPAERALVVLVGLANRRPS